jgi:hypothetical protein
MATAKSRRVRIGKTFLMRLSPPKELQTRVETKRDSST